MSKQSFEGTSILSTAGFTKHDIRVIFRVARRMRRLVEKGKPSDILAGKVMAAVFYEASTRTSSSFIAAMQRLGGQCIPITGVKFSSVSKGETLEDTMRTLERYADVLVLRHKKRDAAARAAAVLRKPLINAGAGDGEHPTQALLDLFTIREELGTLKGLTVTLVGDLKYGRTVHSLVHLLGLYGARLNFVSPRELRLPKRLRGLLALRGVRFEQGKRLEPFLRDSDVFYLTRVQRERFKDTAIYERVKDAYIWTPKTMTRVKKHCIVMHPFPRNKELDPATDADPRAAFFTQIENGLYVRMALLALVLGRA